MSPAALVALTRRCYTPALPDRDPRRAYVEGPAGMAFRRLVPPALGLWVALAGAGVLGLATAFGWGARMATADPPAALPFEAPQAQAIPVKAREPATRITGVVVDEAGRPVAGATVNVIWFRKTPEDVTTAADGAFSLVLGGQMRRMELVQASVDGGARLGVAQFDESFSPTPVPIRIVLKPARVLTVRVTDVAGAPVEGAAVEVPSRLYGSLALALTDARGLARFRLPADAEVMNVTALKPGVGFDFFENYRYWPPIGEPAALPGEVSLTLDGARRVEIKLIDADGRPVPGVALSPAGIHKRGKLSDVNLTGSDTALATTDAQGVARFDWFPKRIEEQVAFAIRWHDYNAADMITINPSAADTTVTARVVRSVRLAGKVFLPDGTPAADVLLSGTAAVTGQSRIGSLLTRTAADGSYSANVIPGQTYTIAFLDPRGAAPPLARVSIEEDHPLDGLDLRMTEGTLVRGRVTRGPEKTPAVRERVHIEMPIVQQGRSIDLWATTDDDGRYVARLSPGQYSFSAEYAGPNARVEVNVPGRGEVVRDLTAAEQKRRLPTMPFVGVVVERVGAEKRVVAGAELRELVTGTTGFAPVQAAADAQGRFVAAVGARPKLLYARSPDGLRAGYFEVPAAGEVEVPVAKAAMLIGRAVDRDGRPVAGRWVSLSVSRGEGALTLQSMFWETFTDETGGFQFLGLVPGSKGWIGVAHSNDVRPLLNPGLNPEVREVQVRGPDPILLQDFIVPPDPPGK